MDTQGHIYIGRGRLVKAAALARLCEFGCKNTCLLMRRKGGAASREEGL